MEKPIIYLDLDETLIHSIDWWNVIPPIQHETLEQDFEVVDVILPASAYGNSEKYKTIIRPYAREFVNNLRELGFTVKICTAATVDYSLSILNSAEFGFIWSDILDREEVQYLKAKNNINPDNKKTDHSILVDNLDETQHNTKVKLEALGGNCKLIICPSFDLATLDADHEKIFNNITEQIVNFDTL